MEGGGHRVAAYLPGDSPVHRLHPLTKVAWIVGMLFFAFLLHHAWLLFGITAAGILLIFYSGTWSGYWRSVLVILPIILGLIFLQSVAPAFPPPWTPITKFGPFTFYQEGVYNGLLLASRVTTIVTFALLAVLTTHPGDMAVGLRSAKVPHQLTFMVMTTLQLIPIFQRELEIILSAQRSRAMKSTGFGALLPSLVPIFAGAIERVNQLSMSLEARGFGSSGEKTSLREVEARPIDFYLGPAGLVVGVLALYLVFRHDSLRIGRDVVFDPTLATGLALGSAGLFLVMVVGAFFKLRSVGR